MPEVQPIRCTGQDRRFCIERKGIHLKQRLFTFPRSVAQLMEADDIPYRWAKSPVLRDRIGGGQWLVVTYYRQPVLPL
jgi:hypothetical protein